MAEQQTPDQALQARELFEKPWRDRQLLVVVGKDTELGKLQAGGSGSASAQDKTKRTTEMLLRAGAAYATLGLSELALIAGSKKVREGYKEGFKKVGGLVRGEGRKRKQEPGLKIPSLVTCTPAIVDQAMEQGLLQEPYGGFMYETVYTGHPHRPPVYALMADFHRFLFEDKATELFRLLECLGATRVSVSHVSHVSGTRSAKGSLGVDAFGLKGELEKQRTEKSEIVYEASYQPTHAPYVPDDLVWYPGERTWQRIVHSRLNTGLLTINVDLHYQQDYQITGDLAAGLEELGFSLGGKFVDYEEVVWKVQGEFAPKEELPG
jgi:hypothetical protein